MIATILAAAIMAASPLSKGGKDWVYVYGAPNRTYLCDAYFPYFETEGHSIYYADKCVQVGQDFTNWPPFQKQAIFLSLDFEFGKVSPIRQNCQFVSHTDAPDDSSSWTNVDCR